MSADRFESGQTRPADGFREAARQWLKGQSPTARQIEVAGLTLFERSLDSASFQAQVTSSLHSSTLAALHGVAGGGLSVANRAVLDDFAVFAQAGSMRTVGDLPDVLMAARTLGPTAQVEVMKDYSIPVHGFIKPEELTHIIEALREVVGKTETKALHLVREIYLRPFLAESLGQDGQPQLVDGLAYGRGRVGLINATAREPQALRRAFFHELGHELDRVLSGGSTFFRSEQSDNPFGKTGERSHYLSDYATTSPAEDFAECHGQLILDWQGVRECPDLFVHSRGVVGEKLAWIWQKGYRLELPPPSKNWSELQKRFPQDQLERICQSLREHWPDPQNADEAWVLRQLRE